MYDKISFSGNWEHDSRLEKKFILPIVIALAKMTPERMNTMIDALLRIVTTFLTRHCPQKPANTETLVRYKAAKGIHIGKKKILVIIK